LDADEPERFANPNQSGLYDYYLGRDLQVGMAYPRMHQQGIFEGYHSVEPQGELIMLSRSAWAGTQRYAAAVWSGDIQSSFAELTIQVRVAQNVAMSGIYWWTTDIGGYGGGNIADPVFRELIVRWFQFGAFCPLFRLHGCRNPNQPSTSCGPSCGYNEIWEFGGVAFAQISKVMAIREQLRPYVMYQMKLAAEEGVPVLRPLLYDFLASDPVVRTAPESVAHEFMFGPDYLVSPVTQYQAKTWRVYLPVRGDKRQWVDWWSGVASSGGVWITKAVDLSVFPLFYVK